MAHQFSSQIYPSTYPAYPLWSLESVQAEPVPQPVMGYMLRRSPIDNRANTKTNNHSNSQSHSAVSNLE